MDIFPQSMPIPKQARRAEKHQSSPTPFFKNHPTNPTHPARMPILPLPKLHAYSFHKPYITHTQYIYRMPPRFFIIYPMHPASSSIPHPHSHRYDRLARLASPRLATPSFSPSTPVNTGSSRLPYSLTRPFPCRSALFQSLIAWYRTGVRYVSASLRRDCLSRGG